jgi:hypothetical protein
MWARAAWAVVLLSWVNGAQAVPIQSIESICWSETDPSLSLDWWGHAKDLKAELCSVAPSVSKDIVIFRPSPNIPLSRSEKISGGDFGGWTMQFGLRADHPISEMLGIREVESIRHPIRKMSGVRINDNSDCRRLAPIKKNWGDPKGVNLTIDGTIQGHPGKPPVRGQVDLFGSYIGSQILMSCACSNLITSTALPDAIRSGPNGCAHIARLGGVALCEQFELTLASFPQLVSSQPKADGGYRQNYSEASDHAFVVVFKESIDRVNRGDYSHVKGGAVFFIIVIGGLLTVLWLYQARR